MAVALTWGGHVDTDVDFSEFFGKSHTLVVRFMPQFPNAYEGPFIAENGTGRFALGQGDFLDGVNGTKLFLAVGTKLITRQASLVAGRWHHLALAVGVTATQRRFSLYFDGSQLGQPFDVAVSEPDMPQGKLRFGRRTSGQTVNGRKAQCYGLLDDIAIFNHALTAAEIQNLRTNALTLTGNEAGLLAGFTFAENQLSAKLARPVMLRRGAAKRSTSANRSSSADARLLPLPERHREMDLPFPPGEAWFVIQGYDDSSQSHMGYASFCWDFRIADQPQQGAYPKGSDGAPFYAAAPGTVVTALESSGPGTGNTSNLVEIQQGPSEICGYLHLQKDKADVHHNDHVRMGQKLGLVGDTGTNVGAFHLHLATTDKTDGSPGFVTFPVTFSDYQRRDTTNGWANVQRGMPKRGDVIRIPPTPTFGPRSLGVGSSIARHSDRIDLVATASDGQVWATRFDAGTYVRVWDRWRPVLAHLAAPDTPVAVVSRADDHLDVFMAGSDGRTYTGASSSSFDGQWRGWWNILKGAVPSGGTVTAVARAAGKLDVFIVSTDGGVYTAAWDQNVAAGAWRGWWRIGSQVAKPGSPVAVVSRHPDKLDIFVAGTDGKTHTAAWDKNLSGGQWRGWWNILTGSIPAGGTITPVARGPEHLDIFLTSTDGGVYTASWDQNIAGGRWQGWHRIKSLTAKPGSPVAAVARDPFKLDIFVAGTDSKTYTAAWDKNVSGGMWRGWWNIQTGRIAPGTPVSAVSRAPDRLDVFIVSTDKRIYTAAWAQNVAAGAWQGWWRIGV